MSRDPNDCRCAGATRVQVKDPNGKPVVDEHGQPVYAWTPNGPADCPVHPHGYDPDTGRNE